jgi:hypothetical protein
MQTRSVPISVFLVPHELRIIGDRIDAAARAAADFSRTERGLTVRAPDARVG